MFSEVSHEAECLEKDTTQTKRGFRHTERDRMMGLKLGTYMSLAWGLMVCAEDRREG